MLLPTCAPFTLTTLQAASNKRYVEPSSLSIRSGTEIAQDVFADELVDLKGELDVDLTELSLGQRLTALDPLASRPADAENSDSDDPERPTARTIGTDQPNSITLTRILIQALHSTELLGLSRVESHVQRSHAHHADSTTPAAAVGRAPTWHMCPAALGRTSAPGTQRTQRAACSCAGYEQ